MKITVTLPRTQVAAIRSRVAARKSASISGFIQDAVERSLDAETEFRALIEDVLQDTGGPSTAKERAWAQQALAPRRHRAKRKAA